METVNFRGNILTIKDGIFTDGVPSLKLVRDNYAFFQRLENPLSDKEIKKQTIKVTKDFTDSLKGINSGDLPDDIKKALIETEKNIWESEKMNIINSGIIESSKEEIEQLCRSLFVEEIDYENVDAFELIDVVTEIKKKQLITLTEKPKE